MTSDMIDTLDLEEAAAWRDKCLRATAEMQNIRRRHGERLRGALARDRRDILEAFLEPLDNLERALAAGEADDPLLAGVAGVRSQMLAALRRFGAEPIAAEGQAFDPNIHEAVACRPVPGCPEGTVAEVVQTGYLMENGAVLRPSRVVVAGDRRSRTGDFR